MKVSNGTKRRPGVQRKPTFFNTYMDFIESGQLFEKFPEAKGKNIVFRLQSTFAPSAQALELVEIIKRNYLVPASIGFESSELK